MSDPIIRLLAFEDLDEALKLSVTAGWNQPLDDLRMLLQLAPTGAFAALSDARLVGTAIGIDYGGFAWIAMMLVDPAYRGRGVGRRLLEAAMDAVPSHLPIRLDATTLGRPMYQRYGFEDETMLSPHVAEGGVLSASKTLDGSQDVHPLTASDLRTLGRGESRHGLRGTEQSATEARRHRDESKDSLCLSSLWRILRVSQPVRAFCHGGC